jgi:hypothetical protein
VEKKELVERDNEAKAVARQCEPLGLFRSSYYYSSARDDEYDLELIRRMGLQALFPTRGGVFLQGLGYRMPYEVYFGHSTSKKPVEMGILNALNNKKGRSKIRFKPASLLSKECEHLKILLLLRVLRSDL